MTEAPSKEAPTMNEAPVDSPMKDGIRVRSRPKVLVRGRPKLQVRRAALPGVVIREPSATPTSEPTKGTPTEKGKEKVVYKAHTERQERPYWMVNKRAKTVGLPRHGKDAENHGNLSSAEKEALRLETFKHVLIGIGLGKLFMPTPGFDGAAHQPNGTPSEDSLPVDKGGVCTQASQTPAAKKGTPDAEDVQP
ncbi:hypothetical protein DCAR_0831145 [Daucus carota subsp. sativus]|uniref:Uncharacterized protein n=1 Tax=Daucus carota subsp. sativus TaxID=79200 RepID=A0A175YMD7_DAUCS|nr:hypothetical protein DCAR_0831145 [Daucus carota subsp. sativus]